MKSGQTDFKTVAILRWDPATAQKRMEDLLTSTYSGGAKVQGVLSPYDGLSIGILSALKSNGYGTAGQPYPIVTGQDAEVASVKSIIAGEQYSTIYKDTRQLADVTVKMADAVLKGGKPEVNNTKDYDNGNKVVPVVPAAAGGRLQGQLPEGARRLRLLHGQLSDQLGEPVRHPVVTEADMSDASCGCAGSPRRSPASRRCRTSTCRCAAARSTPSAARTAPGKSTLMKVLSGVYPHGSYEGEIHFDGEPCAFAGIRDSEQRGIVIIHQELALCPQLSIAENIFLGNERATRGLIDWNRTNARGRASCCARVGLRGEPGHPGASTSASASSSSSRSPRRCPRRCGC